MKYRVIHRTEYHYSDQANICHNVAHLSPRADVPGQACASHYLSVVPRPAILQERTDHFGNRLHYFSIESPHRDMIVTATSTIETKPEARAVVESSSAWRTFAEELALRPAAEQASVREYILHSPMIPQLPGLADYAAPSFEKHESIFAAATDITKRIFRDFKYDQTFTTLATPLKDVLEHKRGVCQDFAHLQIGCLRSIGLAARYVSGYIETIAPPGKEKLTGTDASHAWVSVFIPDAGWCDLDPTNNQPADHRYITIGWGRDYSDVPPLKGVIFGGGTATLAVSVDVEPVR